jgi:hypothetical protein
LNPRLDYNQLFPVHNELQINVLEVASFEIQGPIRF